MKNNKSKLNVSHCLLFWLNTEKHPYMSLLEIILFSLLGFLYQYIYLVVMSSIVGLISSLYKEKILIVMLLSVIMLILKSLMELIDAHLVLKGSIALNKANKDIVVPSLSNIKYQTFITEKIQVLLIEIQKLVRGGDSSKLGQIYRSLWNLLTAFFGLLLLSGVFARLSLPCILLVFFIFIVSYLIRRKLLKVALVNHNNQLKYDRSLRYIERVHTDKKYSKDIRTWDWNETISEKLDEAVHGKCRYKSREERELEGGKLISFLGRFASLFIVITALILKKKNGSGLKLEEITFFFLSINSIWSWLESSLNEIENISVASNDIAKFIEVKKEGDAPNKQEEVLSIEPDAPFILFDSISFGYEEGKTLFDNFSLAIKKGERVGIVGENGSGKSTLIMLLLGLLKPSKGRILIEGKVLDEYERRSYFSPIFQYLRMYPSSLGKIVSGEEEMTEERRDKIIELSKSLPISHLISSLPFGLDTPLVAVSEEGAVDLSGGESQWVMILRALMKDSPILILDEANSALDTLGEETLYKVFQDIKEDKTMLFISHRLSFKNICSRIVVLQKGRVVEDGSPSILMNKKGVFYEMYNKEKREALDDK